MFSNFYFEFVPFMRFCGKYGRTIQATDENMTHARCMLNTEGYKHKLIIWNALIFRYNSCYNTTPQCYGIRTMPVLFDQIFIVHYCTETRHWDNPKPVPYMQSYQHTSLGRAWVRRLVAGLSPRKPGGQSRNRHFGICGGMSTNGTGFSPNIWFEPPMLHNHSSITDAMISQKPRASLKTQFN